MKIIRANYICFFLFFSINTVLVRSFFIVRFIKNQFILVSVDLSENL